MTYRPYHRPHVISRHKMEALWRYLWWVRYDDFAGRLFCEFLDETQEEPL